MKNISLLMIMCCFGLSACGSLRPTVDSTPVMGGIESYPYDMTKDIDVMDNRVTVEAAENHQTPVNPSNPAVNGLLKLAYEQLQAGDYTKAAASLERAQRIDPRNPLVYRQLAWARFAQGNYPLAEQIARRAISLTQYQKLQHEMTQLIEQCQVHQNAR